MADFSAGQVIQAVEIPDRHADSEVLVRKNVKPAKGED